MSKHRGRYASSYSADIVSYLQSQEKTLEEIGNLMQLSTAYVSYVKNGTKRFTMDRLKMLESALKMPLPLILLESIGITRKNMSKAMMHQYRSLQKILIISKKL